MESGWLGANSHAQGSALLGASELAPGTASSPGAVADDARSAIAAAVMIALIMRALCDGIVYLILRTSQQGRCGHMSSFTSWETEAQRG